MYVLKFKAKPVWRETSIIVRDPTPGIVCVALQPEALLLRLKGRRQILTMPFSGAYDRACWLEAARRRMEKLNAKKAKKKARRK